MKRKGLFCLLVVLIMILAACGDNADNAGIDDMNGPEESNGADEPIICKIVHIAADSDPYAIGFVYLKDIIEERTNGRISVEIYGNKLLTNSDEENAEMVRSNMAQVTASPNYSVAAMNKELANFYIYDYPYMFRTMEEIWDFSDSEIGMRMVDDLINKTGTLKSFGSFPKDWIKVSTKQKPINSPNDIKGLKIRSTTSELYMSTLEALGANPTPIAFGEIFTALQQGTVDGLMAATDLFVSQRFYELQHEMSAFDPFVLIHYSLVNDEWYKELPEDLRAIFDECMADYIVHMRKSGQELEEISKKQLREQGMNIIEYDDETIRPFIDACMPIWEEKVDVVGGQEFIDEVVEWIEDYRLSN